MQWLLLSVRGNEFWQKDKKGHNSILEKKVKMGHNSNSEKGAYLNLGKKLKRDITDQT